MGEPRLTPPESNELRCQSDLVQDDRLVLESLKMELDMFMLHRINYDRAQMVYLSGNILRRVAEFFTPFLCDIGTSMYQETLTDADYNILIERTQVQGSLQEQARERARDRARGRSKERQIQTQKQGDTNEDVGRSDSGSVII